MHVLIGGGMPIKVWLDEELDQDVYLQARNLCFHPFVKHHVALMPDTHIGYGMPIGGVIATQGAVIPNAVGVDIGCGMQAVRTDLTELPKDKVKLIIGEARKLIPTGFKHRERGVDISYMSSIPRIKVLMDEVDSAKKQIGTLGGGNHFIEIQKGDDGFIWLMIHSGSRNLGHKVASHYHNIAKEMCERWKSSITTMDLAFLPLDTVEGEEYMVAMKYCVLFARINRNFMRMAMQHAFDIVLGLNNTRFSEPIDISHNYADMENHFGKNYLIHRKGATRARKGEIGIIPGSMGTKSYIVKGKGNADSFESSSHGAGRILGRNQAKKTLDLKEEQEKMKGIVHGLRNDSDLDEAPGAYKDIDEVMRNQEELVEILTELKPLGVLKG